MGDLEVKPGSWGHPSNQPLTWMCPEGHVFRYRQRPLLSSCIFIFCFFLMERAALYVLKTFLYVHLERTLNLNPYTPSFGYMMISLFFGVYDSSPILVAYISDTYLGGYKSAVIFGFVFVFGLTLTALIGGSWFGTSVGPSWCAMVSLLGLVAVSAGGLGPCLTAFGGAQFHPETQTSSGSKFFSFIFASTNVGALVGITTALVVYALWPFRYLLLSAAALGSLGWISFLIGSALYVRRCVHTLSVKRIWAAVWACIKRGSFSANKQEYPEVDDLRIVARLIPIFACLIPLYLGQVQVLTTMRTLGYKLRRPSDFFTRSSMPAELLLLFEPVTAILLSVLLSYVVYPGLARRGQMPSHLTRLTVGGVAIFAGFVTSFAIQRTLMTSGSEFSVFQTYSVFILVAPLVLFSAGQTLITSSGFEISFTYAPEAVRSAAISTFSLVYAFGAIVSVALFGLLSTLLDEPAKTGWTNRSTTAPISIRLDVYFAICAGLCLVSVLALVALRGFHGRTRTMRIEQAIERRALAIIAQQVAARTNS